MAFDQTETCVDVSADTEGTAFATVTASVFVPSSTYLMANPTTYSSSAAYFNFGSITGVAFTSLTNTDIISESWCDIP
jgi:hypothetical protein